MRITRTISELRAALADASDAADTGSGVGFVPTMGALHDGHLSLVRAARADNAVVVLSIFVNPTQFTEAADLEAYPRQEAADTDAAAGAGVDVLFVPAATEMYPDGSATTVSVRGSLTDTLEGASRGSGHFDGMATIVTKLLLAVGADRAYFGEKDAQQLRVVRRMVRDLGLPCQIVGCPTTRDADGLALSSRNVRLSRAERERARAIPRALDAMAAALADGETRSEQLRDLAAATLLTAGLTAEYIAVVHADSLEPLERITDQALCLIAARVGEVRLIDNTMVFAQTPVTDPQE